MLNGKQMVGLPNLVNDRQYIYQGRVVKSKMHLSREGGTQTFADTIELEQVEDDMESPSPIQTPAKDFDTQEAPKRIPVSVKGVKDIHPVLNKSKLRPKRFEELQTRLVSLH